MDNQYLPTPEGKSRVIIGGGKVQTIDIPSGTPFQEIFGMIRQAGFTDARVRTFDPVTHLPIEITMQSAPNTFENGRTYEILPYDRPGLK
jgi:hypothetical protein